MLLKVHEYKSGTVMDTFIDRDKEERRGEERGVTEGARVQIRHGHGHLH